MNNQITFCAVYRNEAQRVRISLDFARSFFSNIILVVQNSEDGTLSICREYTGNIIERPSESPEESKDFIMEKVITPWTFWLDADEIPSQSVIRYLETFDPLLVLNHDAISFNRINYIDGYAIDGGQGNDVQFRMMRKDVRWKTKERGKRIHIHPIVDYPLKIERDIYHHRTLEKVEKLTERWNNLEPQTKGVCDQYLKKVKEELAWKTKR